MRIVGKGMELEQCRPAGRRVLDSFKNLHTSQSVWLGDGGRSEDQQERSLEREVGNCSWRTCMPWERAGIVRGLKWSSTAVFHAVDLRMVPDHHQFLQGTGSSTGLFSVHEAILFLLGSCPLGFFCCFSYKTSYNSVVDKELNCVCLASQKGSSLPALACVIWVPNQPRKILIFSSLPYHPDFRWHHPESLEPPIHQW